MHKYLLHHNPKHRTRSDQSYVEEPAMMVGTQVYPQQQEPFFIGIYGPDGQPIYAMQERVRIGYCSQKLDQD